MNTLSRYQKSTISILFKFKLCSKSIRVKNLHINESMNPFFLAICAFVTGIFWMASAPIKTALIGFGYDIVPDDNILIAVIAILFFLVIKRLHFLVGYTDEVLPLYLSLIGLALAAGGVFLFTRLMFLGGLCLVAGAYWSNGVVESYYRK